MDSSRRGEVSFLLRRLEPSLAWALAACIAWTTALLDPTEPRAWALALYAGAIGFWSRRFPAHRHWLMFVRGMLLLAGTFALLGAPSGPGPAGAAFAWPLMIVTGYSLALGRRWAAALAASALLLHGTATFLTDAAEWRLALVQAGVLALFCAVAMLFGIALRQLDSQAEQARRDRSSRLYNEQGFFHHGGELFEECRRLRRPFTLVLLNGADVREVSDLVGRNAANELFAHLAAELNSATPRNGIAARVDENEFIVALPGMQAEAARALLRERLGDPPRVALKCRGDLVTVMLDMLVAEATPDMASLEDFHERLHAKVLYRFGVQLPEAPDRPTTVRGLLNDEAPPLPRHARPTLPMGLRPHRRHV